MEPIFALFPQDIMILAAGMVAIIYILVQRLAKSNLPDWMLVLIQIITAPLLTYGYCLSTIRDWQLPVFATLVASIAALAKSPVYDVQVEKKAKVIDVLKAKAAANKPAEPIATTVSDQVKVAEKDVEEGDPA